MCKIRSVVFVGNARCFHTMDWYRSAQRILAPAAVPFVTDLIESEGNQKLVQPGDPIVALMNVDWLLFRKQSRVGNLWRNAVKAVLSPLQVLRLRSYVREQGRATAVLCHAHTMYYMWLCWMARVQFVGTPQGSEILVRPKRSRIYRFFAARALAAAKDVTVDSEAMRAGVRLLSGRDARVVQNGIDVSAITALRSTVAERKRVVSIRIIASLYRTQQILEARNRMRSDVALTFVYPQWEDGYRSICRGLMKAEDTELGRLPRSELYRLLVETLLVVSIPESDSSPRSVYEAVFCGCCVAVTFNPWIEILPDCMRARLVVVDLADGQWFEHAMARAKEVAAIPYEPSPAALDLFDQERSMRRVVDSCYV